jgi:hypothetical protein
MLDPGAPYGAARLTVEDFRLIHSKLGDYETQTVGEIWGSTDNGCKQYDLDDAHANIITRLRDIEKDDETALHTLRLTGAFRVYGVLRENVFHVLWLDPQHEMWPSQKKGT